jgi:hypothetical protein
MSTLPATARLRWRVVVRTEGKLDPSRPSRPLSWHLISCAAPDWADAHCLEGRRLLTEVMTPTGTVCWAACVHAAPRGRSRPSYDMPNTC